MNMKHDVERLLEHIKSTNTRTALPIVQCIEATKAYTLFCLKSAWTKTCALPFRICSRTSGMSFSGSGRPHHCGSSNRPPIYQSQQRSSGHSYLGADVSGRGYTASLTAGTVSIAQDSQRTRSSSIRAQSKWSPSQKKQAES